MSIKKMIWGCAVVAGMMTLPVSFAALTPTPTALPNQITDDTALYQKLSEIKARKESNPTFDSDIAKLSSSESRYAENLPILAKSPRLRTPMERIAKTKYHYVAKHTAATSSND